MPDLATIFGTQVQEKLKEIHRDAPARGYLDTLEALGVPVGLETNKEFRAVGNKDVSGDRNNTKSEGNGASFALPPGTVVEPDAGGVIPVKPVVKGRVLQYQVPYTDESGQKVLGYFGPKSAPFVPVPAPTLAPEIVPLPNPGAGWTGYGGPNHPVPYDTPPAKKLGLMQMAYLRALSQKMFGTDKFAAQLGDVGPEI
jgi:hypothetical protein